MRVIGTVVQFSEDQMKQLIAREEKNLVSIFYTFAIQAIIGDDKNLSFIMSQLRRN